MVVPQRMGDAIRMERWLIIMNGGKIVKTPSFTRVDRPPFVIYRYR